MDMDGLLFVHVCHARPCPNEADYVLGGGGGPVPARGHVACRTAVSAHGRAHSIGASLGLVMPLAGCRDGERDRGEALAGARAMWSNSGQLSSSAGAFSWVGSSLPPEAGMPQPSSRLEPRRSSLGSARLKSPPTALNICCTAGTPGCPLPAAPPSLSRSALPVGSAAAGAAGAGCGWYGSAARGWLLRRVMTRSATMEPSSACRTERGWTPS
mmetsp:Transcript_56618/g.148627  ORF Transcript_56618/g.148627 Transcript_56618/m.148627 type:complete len:213 (+) Transcript_56618:112-750(+)